MWRTGTRNWCGAQSGASAYLSAVTHLPFRLVFFKRLAGLPVFLLLLNVWTAAGQSAGSPDSVKVEFMPRYAFHLSAERLFDSDSRFVWDANFGGEVDFVDYGRGRLTFEANYQAVLGEEIRAFDPNQGNYVLSPRLSLRVKGTEAAAVFYHQSRHFSDRAKQVPVDWNMAGVRVGRTFKPQGASVETRVDLRKVVAKTSVDYNWEVAGNARSVSPLWHGTDLIVDATVRVLGVNGSRNRGTQYGYRAEGGVRFNGSAGAIELYVAGERRIDPYPLEFSTAEWIATGFRFVSRP